MTQKGPTMTETVEKIAAKLTEAQRKLLLQDPAPREQFCDLRTLGALERKGLTYLYLNTYSFENKVFPTPLGIAVRRHLQEQGS